jgi:hypothetical protein
MELLPEKRFGIFLIAISVWYLVNLQIFDALQPILAVPGSVTFLAGLWLVLSPFTPTVSTMLITKLNAPSQASAPAATKPETTPTSKPATKTKPKITKMTKTTPLSVKKHVRKKKTTSKSSA